MRVIKNIGGIERIIEKERKKGKIIGLVPTMGYLHKGHLSLVKIAKRESDFVVVSIFVNPSQFGPNEDYKEYPRDLKRDKALLKREGTDLIFLPSVKEMYPEGYKTLVSVQGLSTILCGASRPTHFTGVTTVVLKLFNIVGPNIAVFGKKDYQQGVIIKRMVRDLNLNIKILLGPTIRERDGVAMSSRNTYLTKRERRDAMVLYQSLKWGRKAFQNGFSDPTNIIKKIRQIIEEKGGKIDYIEAVDKVNLKPVKKLKRGTVICLAVYFGRARLIDNIEI